MKVQHILWAGQTGRTHGLLMGKYPPRSSAGDEAVPSVWRAVCESQSHQERPQLGEASRTRSRSREYHASDPLCPSIPTRRARSSWAFILRVQSTRVPIVRMPKSTKKKKDKAADFSVIASFCPVLPSTCLCVAGEESKAQTRKGQASRKQRGGHIVQCAL